MIDDFHLLFHYCEQKEVFTKLEIDTAAIAMKTPSSSSVIVSAALVASSFNDASAGADAEHPRRRLRGINRNLFSCDNLPPNCCCPPVVERPTCVPSQCNASSSPSWVPDEDDNISRTNGDSAADTTHTYDIHVDGVKVATIEHQGMDEMDVVNAYEIGVNRMDGINEDESYTYDVHKDGEKVATVVHHVIADETGMMGPYSEDINRVDGVDEGSFGAGSESYSYEIYENGNKVATVENHTTIEAGMFGPHGEHVKQVAESNDGPVGPWSLPSHDEEELVTVVDHTTMKTGIIGGLVNRIVGVFAPVSPEDIIPVNTEDSGDR